jgi:hypothetical protein
MRQNDRRGFEPQPSSAVLFQVEGEGLSHFAEAGSGLVTNDLVRLFVSQVSASVLRTSASAMIVMGMLSPFLPAGCRHAKSPSAAAERA